MGNPWNLEENKNESYILFGAQSSLEKFIEHDFDGSTKRIQYVIDNDHKKWNTRWHDVIIQPLSRLFSENKEEVQVIIADNFHEYLQEQLETMGFQKDVHFFIADVQI